MKFFYYYLIFFLCTSSFAANQSIAQTITGTIANGKGDSLIYFGYSSGHQYKKDSVLITDNKQFVKTFSFSVPKTITLTYGALRKEVYIFPKADLHIRFNAINDSLFTSTFSVTGDYNINQYLSNYNPALHNNYVYDRMIVEKPIDSLVPILHHYRKYSDSLRSSFFKQVHQSRNTKAVHDFMITDSINWYCNSLLQAMDYMHLIQNGSRALFWKNEVESRLPLSFSELYLNSFFYSRIWYFYFRSVREQALEGADSVQAEGLSRGSYALDYIHSNKIQNQLKEVIAKQVVYDILYHYSDLSVEEARREDSSVIVLTSMISDKPFVDDFSKEYRAKQDLVRSRRLGTKAPDFSLSDTSGRMVSLEDFKGKIILIDVWASWCGPCIEEMPHLKKLADTLQDKTDFSLLSVSIDNTKEVWMNNGISRVHPPGLLLWQGSNQNFAESYDIGLIPQMILLDKNGNYIDFNPPRASDGNKLYRLIIEHLN